MPIHIAFLSRLSVSLVTSSVPSEMSCTMRKKYGLPPYSNHSFVWESWKMVCVSISTAAGVPLMRCHAMEVLTICRRALSDRLLS